MIVAGFDPGSLRFGLAVLQDRDGSIKLLHSETVILKPKDFRERMTILWMRLQQTARNFDLDGSAMEEGFLGPNARSQNVLAQVRGVVMASMIHHSVPLNAYSPRTVKQAVTGNGNAGKEQVQQMIRRLLRLDPGEIGDDESDAMAVAYCHLLSRPGKAVSRKGARK